MKIKKPFLIFFVVLYSGLLCKYYVHRQISRLHSQEITLQKLKEEQTIVEQLYNREVYEYLTKKSL